MLLLFNLDKAFLPECNLGVFVFFQRIQEFPVARVNHMRFEGCGLVVALELARCEVFLLLRRISVAIAPGSKNP